VVQPGSLGWLPELPPEDTLPPLLWDAIPLGAVVAAVAYAAWTGRPRRGAGVAETVGSHARFRDALREATSRSGDQVSTDRDSATASGEGRR